jgi:sarcosine oxidase
MAGGDTEFAVVGAGALGLSAAAGLARRGHQVVVCEQATVGHGNGGSKGRARIFRMGYDDPGYVRLAAGALRLWRREEERSSTSLLTTTGQVTFGDDPEALTTALSIGGAAYTRMTAPEVAERFPMLSIATAAVFEPEGGVIAADEYLRMLERTPGVEVRPRTRVVRVDEHAGGVQLVVESGGESDALRAAVVVVCAGPWTAPLVARARPGLPSMATLEQVAYLAPAAGPVDSVVASTPVFVERRRPWFYGLPVVSDGLVKISLHGSGPAVALDDLEGPGTAEPAGPEPADPELVAELSASARRLLPGFAAEPVRTERCLYDNTADGDFVVDRFGPFVVGCGTSGHGFKFAPLLGELLADLATGAPHDRSLGTAEDLGRFSSRRLGSPAAQRGPTVHP